jgi:uncharacterized protein involved in exopolysaccharide biosynthesis
MQNKSKINNIDSFDDAIDLINFLHILWRGKFMMLVSLIIFSSSSFFIGINLPNIYESSAILSPVNDQNNSNTPMRDYGNFASLAGINLSSQSNGANSIIALDKIKSLSFFKNNILPNIFLPNLMAIASWDINSNTIIYNNDYDEINQTWVREYKHPKTQIPSAQESYKVFLNNHLKILQDKDTGFVTISVRHQSPFVAQYWADLIVSELNHFFRVKDKAEAQTALEYLNDKISQTNFEEIKESIAQLMQQKTQQLTLIEVSEFYVFEYIDPPAVMESKVEPNRGLILILGVVIGIIFGSLFILIRYFFVRKN